MGNKLMR